MKITFKKTRDYIVIQMSGSLDTKLSREIEEDFEQILSNYPECNILLNMKELKYLSSSGLKTIISLRSVLNDANKQLKICTIGKAAREVFEMTKVLQFFKIYPDEESAILSINEIDPSDFD